MTRIFRFIYFALCLLLVAPTAGALDPTRTLSQALHRIWQTQQGLPQATIYCIRQTSDGYIWLATQTGLDRFDGVRFTTIDDLGGVSIHNVWIRDLLEDSQHNFWLATDGSGLIQWRNNKARQFRRSEGLPSNTISNLFADSSGTLWICTPEGLACYDHGTFKTFGSDQGLATRDIRSVCEAEDGSIWVAGASSTLSQGSIAGFHTVALKSLPAGAEVESLLAMPGGVLYVGTTGGLLRIEGEKQKLFTTADGLANNVVYCLERGQDNCIWVGTQNGFSRLGANDDVESFRSSDGLSQSTVYTLCQDREGSLWAGTKHGLDQFLDRRTVPFTTTEGLPSNDTGPVLEGRDNGVWVGTIGAGLSRFDGHHFSTLTTAQGLASNIVRALAADTDGDIWVGSDHGLTRLHDGKAVRAFTTTDGLPSDLVASIAADRSRGLWIGTDRGAALLRGDKLSRIGNQPVQALIVRRDGSVLAATGNGNLCLFRDGSFQPLKAAESLSRIDCFYEDADGLLWIGTRGGGLAMLQGSKVTTFLVRDGLYDDDLFGVVGDDRDRLWMACSKGIFSVSRSDLRDFAAGKLKSVVSNPFSPTDALRTIECKSDVQPAAARTRDGKLWFSTIHGAIAIDPVHLQRNLPPPPVLVEEVIVNGKAEHPSDVKDLAPGLNNLEFRYTALSLFAPGRTTFRYMLEGFDKNWIDAGIRREAFYTNLPPGKYRFRVLATALDGNSAEAVNAVAFRLEPHFYQRVIFVPLLIALAASLVWMIYWRRVRLIRANARAVLAERSRIARELHDTLMQGFSGVTMEMQALAGRLPQSGERITLEEIIRDAGNCLREARLSVAGLRTNVGPASGLAQSISQATRQITEDKDVRLKLSLSSPPTALLPEVEYNLLRIALEAVTNAAKHSGCRTIEVAMACTADTLTLTIKDDGTGITRSAGAGHYGLIGMKERAAQIGALLDVQSHPASGTVVRVTLPISTTASESLRVVPNLEPRYT